MLVWLACLVGDGPLCLPVPRSTSPSPARAPRSVNYDKSINLSFTVVVEGYHVSGSCLLPERLLAFAFLPRTGTTDTAVLCLARDHAQPRARVALLPEHMSKLDVLRGQSK